MSKAYEDLERARKALQEKREEQRQEQKRRALKMTYGNLGVRKGLDASIRDGFIDADYRDQNELWLHIKTEPPITIEITREEAEMLLEGFDQ